MNDLVPVANSVETYPKAPIPGVPVSMLTGHRELSQLDPLHTHRVRGRGRGEKFCMHLDLYIMLYIDYYSTHRTQPG